jgi:Family of unknown function (DUF5681)
MSNHSDDEPVGYRRPPRKTRWKPGQSGNPKRRYSARRYSALEFLEKQLNELVMVTSGGADLKVSKFEAILWQLHRKILSGDRRALAAWLKYEKVVERNSEIKVKIEFIDNGYTQALSAQGAKKRANNE